MKRCTYRILLAVLFVSSVLYTTADDLCKREGHDIVMTEIKKTGKELSHMHKVTHKLSDGTYVYDFKKCESEEIATFTLYSCKRCDWTDCEVTCSLFNK